MSVFNPLICEHCGKPLESDDAVSIIEGSCRKCRNTEKALVQPVRADQVALGSTAGGTGVQTLLPDRPPRDTPPPDQAVSAQDTIDSSAFDAPRTPVDDAIAVPAVPAAPAVAEPSLAFLGFDAGSSTEFPDVVEMAGGSEPDAAASPHEGRRWFLPPSPPLDAEPLTHHGKRRRDLGIGIAVGLVLTVATTAYFLGGYSFGDGLAITDPAPADVPTFVLRVTPVDAVVTLNGEPVGETDEWGRVTVPVARETDADRQSLEVAAPGYHSVRQPLSAYRGVPEAFVELVRRPFELAVATTPPGADVWIGDTLKGTSPLTLAMDASAGATLSIRKTGFAELTREISPPTEGNRVALALDLERLGPILSVLSEPAGAMIAVNGESVGVAPLRLALEPTYLGREIVIAASFKGHDAAQTRVALPDTGGDAGVTARLVLSRQMSRMKVRTRPPGGRVVVAGRDFGDAPAVIEFDPSETGKPVVIEASAAGTHFGRREVLIPPSGKPVVVTVPLEFCAQRVVFVVGLPTDLGADRFVLLDQLAEQVHRLAPTQRFSIVAATDNGVETWPGDLALEAASGEQKVRAYDRVRSLRPTAALDLDALLDASLALQPTTIWLFVEGDLDGAILDRFTTRVSGDDVSINVVRTTAGSDESRLDRWAARHHGTFTILGRDPLPALALDKSPDLPEP